MDENTQYRAIMDKLNEICQHREESDRKLDTIVLQTKQLQEDLTTVKDDVDNLKTSMDFINEATQNLQRDMEHKVDMELFDRVRDTYDKKIDDLINRSKRNNLVFRNIPEGEEKGKGCIQLIEEILAHHMKIPDVDSIVIEKAHRSTVKDNDKNKNQLSQNGASRRPPPPRPIYARFINEADKDYILRRAPRILKDNPYGPTQAKVIITDDVFAKVSADRKLLREKELPEIRKRPGVKVAFIPYMIPARILYKQDDQWKFYFLPN